MKPKGPDPHSKLGKTFVPRPEVPRCFEKQISSSKKAKGPSSLGIFGRLPLELRQAIWSLAVTGNYLVADGDYSTRSLMLTPYKRLYIMVASKAIRQETDLQFYRNSRFVVRAIISNRYGGTMNVKNIAEHFHWNRIMNLDLTLTLSMNVYLSNTNSSDKAAEGRSEIALRPDISPYQVCGSRYHRNNCFITLICPWKYVGVVDTVIKSPFGRAIRKMNGFQTLTIQMVLPEEDGVITYFLKDSEITAAYYDIEKALTPVLGPATGAMKPEEKPRGGWAMVFHPYKNCCGDQGRVTNKL